MNDTAPKQHDGLPCPVCRVDLVMSDRLGIEIDYCPKCRGVWLDRGELDKIIERSLREPNAPQEQPSPSFLPPQGTAAPWGSPPVQPTNQGYPPQGAQQPAGYQGGYDSHGGGHRGGHGGSHGSGHGGGHGGGHGSGYGRRGLLGRIFD